MKNALILDELFQVINSRKGASPDSSYTASLLSKGIDKILKKLGEEATETVIAGKGGTNEEVVYETADLFYHALVLLAARDIGADEVWSELERRFGRSGIEEKQSRQG
jgi:phosphoribosyl-ATP pyrophosphohydrolase